MNTVQIRIATALEAPRVIWEFDFSSATGKWSVGMEDCEKADFAALGDVIHSPNIPRPVRGMLADLLQGAALWEPWRA